MKQPALPLGVAAILAVAISAAVGAGVLASGQRLELALALAAFILASLHLVIFLYRDLGYRNKFAGMRELHLRGRRLAEELAGLKEQIEELDERRAAALVPPPPVQEMGDLNREFEELRRSVKKLAEDYNRVKSTPELRQDPELPAREPAGPARHRLEFFLEPIVSIHEDVTVHYRTSLMLEGPGRPVGFDELSRQAAANGLRADLDGHAVSRALGVGLRLAEKRPGTCIFVPIGPETLGSDTALAGIEWQMRQAGEAASTIVFEIDHAAMAALTSRGIEGLARLARNGAGMALARAHGMGIDLAALRDLKFRFISFSAAALPADSYSIPAWAETARLASEYGFEIAVQGLYYEEQANVASRWAALGSGPVFASPRRVKGEALSVDDVRRAA